MKKNILLLHGAIGAEDQLVPILNTLNTDYQVFSFNFQGHGGEDPDMFDFSMAAFAQQIVGFLNRHKLYEIHIFGYSMGGYVAAYLAAEQPERVQSLFTLATKWHWDKETAAREVKMLNANKIEEKLPAFAQALAQRHGAANWKNVLHKTADMLLAMGEDNPLKTEHLSAIQCPVRLAVGDKDTMVSLEETIAAYRQFPNASLWVMPQTQHPIEKVDVKGLCEGLKAFVG